MRAAPARRVGGGRAGGFSLLELVVAIAILTGVGLATSVLLVPISRQTRIVRETRSANAAAQRVLEKIQATPFKDIRGTYPPASEHPILDLPGGKVTITYADPDADPLVVRAQVSWQSPDLGSMSRTFSTARTE